MFSVFIICLSLLPMVAEAKRLNYFVYSIIRMSESIYNNVETHIADDMGKVKGQVNKSHVICQ